jgi:hypothetical protein
VVDVADRDGEARRTHSTRPMSHSIAELRLCRTVPDVIAWRFKGPGSTLLALVLRRMPSLHEPGPFVAQHLPRQTVLHLQGNTGLRDAYAGFRIRSWLLMRDDGQP